VETHTFHKINSPHHGSAHIPQWKQNSVTALNFITPSPPQCRIRNKASTGMRFVTDFLLVMPSSQGNDGSKKKFILFRIELVIMSN